VHARSVVAAALDGVTGEVLRARLTPEYRDLAGWLEQLPGPVAVTYEAGPTGFGLARFLAAAGVECRVAAPSKLQRPTGDRVKTDARDALHLARLLALGEVVEVTVPSVSQEAARDLVRAREDARSDLMGARHRLSKLLLRHGIVYYGGKAWTRMHDTWLRQQQFDQPAPWYRTCEAPNGRSTRKWTSWSCLLASTRRSPDSTSDVLSTRFSMRPPGSSISPKPAGCRW
jgi:transposase